MDTFVIAESQGYNYMGSRVGYNHHGSITRMQSQECHEEGSIARVKLHGTNLSQRFNYESSI